MTQATAWSLPWPALEDRVGRVLDLLALAGVSDRVAVAAFDILLAPPRRGPGRPRKDGAHAAKRCRQPKPPAPRFTGRVLSTNGKIRCFLDGHIAGQADWRKAIVARGLPDPVAVAREALARVATAGENATPSDVVAASDAMGRLTKLEQVSVKKALGIISGDPKRPGAIGRILEEAMRPVDVRSIYAREARKAGFDANDLFALAMEYRKAEGTKRAELWTMLKQARKLYKSQTGKRLTLAHEAFTTGDHTSLPSFELVARTIADRWPGLLDAGDSFRAAEQLRDLLVQGVPPATKDATLYDRALTYLLESRTRSGEDGGEDWLAAAAESDAVDALMF